MSRHAALFLCSANSARSQIAEGLMRKYGGDRFDVYSAGLELKEINPLTIRVMEEVGIDMKDHYPKLLSAFLGKVPIRYAIIVCARAESSCPRVWPFGAIVMSWPFDDPAAETGSEVARIAKSREVRDDIKSRILGWLAEVEDD